MSNFFSVPWNNTTAIALIQKEGQWYKIEANNSNWHDGFYLEEVHLSEEMIEGMPPYKERGVVPLSDAEVTAYFQEFLPVVLQLVQ